MVIPFSEWYIIYLPVKNLAQIDVSEYFSSNKNEDIANRYGQTIQIEEKTLH